MFKRVERKLKRKWKEEELGIDGDMKEVLGIQDTDSDDESDSSESESESSSRDGVGGGLLAKGSFVEEKWKVDSLEGDEDEDEERLSDEQDEQDDDDDVHVSIGEALHDPLHVVSIQPYTRACIVCPGKLLKNPKMEEVHKISKAHCRRFARFKELARGGADPEDNARDVLKNDGPSTSFSSPPTMSSGKLSNRAIKRVAKFEQIKKRRQNQKAAMAKALAPKASSTASDEPDKKGPRKMKPDADTSGGAHPKPKSLIKPLDDTGQKSKFSTHISIAEKAQVKSISKQPKKRQKLPEVT